MQTAGPGLLKIEKAKIKLSCHKNSLNFQMLKNEEEKNYISLSQKKLIKFQMLKNEKEKNYISLSQNSLNFRWEGL